MKSREPQLFHIYKALYQAYGPQHWWPGNTRLEVILGAILTQNTAWTNVEKAIQGLKNKNLLLFSSLKIVSHKKLANAIRPAGFFNVKADRIQHFVAFLKRRYRGSLRKLLSQPVGKAREELLAIHGIGRETADSILLYAAEKPIFVVDAYTRRIFHRLGVLDGQEDYDEIRRRFESEIPKKPSLYNEYHALIVTHAKEVCRKKPLCEICPLNKECPKLL